MKEVGKGEGVMLINPPVIRETKPKGKGRGEAGETKKIAILG